MKAMGTFNYSTFTKKQAGIVYAAIKRGELSASKKTVADMYDLVGKNMLEYDEAVLRGSFERCVGHIVEGRIEFAQAELDGKRTRKERVLVGYVEHVADPENNDDDWFFEPGEIIRDEVYEERWVIA